MAESANDAVVVVGAGLMGSGIAQVAAGAGRTVILRDVTDEALERGRSGIARSLDRFVGKGTLSREAADAALGRITTTTDLGCVSEAGLVVEAVFESLEVKTELFGELDRLAPDGAVLATNTSAIPITRIAAATKRPESVVGTHFFSPVPMMALCELVRGYKTSDETLESARAFAESVGKTCVVVNRDVAGFVTTRLITALAMEAVRLVETGVASAEDIDIACKLGFGHAMGPLATTDLTGVDILRNAAQNIYDETQDEKFAPPELLNRMVSAGDLGRKSGRGFYSYPVP
jgi:3-hydroxybutyryl-CoA dehydrogenase